MYYPVWSKNFAGYEISGKKSSNSAKIYSAKISTCKSSTDLCGIQLHLNFLKSACLTRFIMKVEMNVFGLCSC